MPSEFFCIILDQVDHEDPPESFAVQYIATQTVHGLKINIKKEKSDIAAIDLDKLVLYQVNLDRTNEQTFKKELEDISQDLSKATKLRAPQKLSSVFGATGPSEKKVHILVKPLAGESINSTVCGPVAQTM